MSKIKEKLFFVAHVHKFFLVMPSHARRFAPNEKPYRSYITLEDRRFGFNFREVSVAIIFNLIWVFHGILPKCCPIYAKASHVMQLD